MPLEDVTQGTQDYPVYDLEGARKAGVSETDIFNHFKKTNPNDFDYDGAIKAGITPDKINDYIANKVNTTPSWQKFKNDMAEAADKTIGLVRPIADSLGVTLGTAAGLPTVAGGPVGGTIGGVTADALMQRLMSSQGRARNRSTLAEVAGTEKDSTSEAAANAVQNVGLNELLGGLFNKVSGVAKNITKPNSPLEDLEPTFSQLHSKDQNPGKLSSLVENIFAPDSKMAAMANSAKLAKETFGRFMESPEIAGAQNIPTTDRMAIGSLNKRFTSGVNKVNELGSNVSAPSVNPTLPSGNVNPFPAGSDVKAPIYLTNTVNDAKQYLVANANNPSADQNLIKTAKLIIDHTNGGKNPIPFQDAMDLLHGNDAVSGFEGKSLKAPGELSPSKDQFGSFSDALDKDIQGSITSKWNSPQALSAYQDARASSLIKAQIARGGKVQDLVGNSNTPIPSIDNILRNTNETQKLLNRSNVDGLPSTNMRQDLAGYRLNQIWAKGQNNGNLDGNAILKEWNNPAFQDTKDQLYSKETQKQLGEFFQNVNKVTANSQAGNYGLIRTSTHGILLAGNLIRGLLSGNMMGGLESAATMEVPAYALAKIMTKPAAAKIMQRLATGAPLEASEQQAGRLIMSGLNGLTVNLMDSQGNEKPVKILNGQVQ